MINWFKKEVIYVLLSLCCILFCGCSNTRNPLSVTFIDISGAMSSDHTINIKFSEEDGYKDKYVDILVKCDTEDVELTLFQEFSKENEKVKLKLDKSMGYVSLDEYKLFNLQKEQTDSMISYGDVLATNLVVNSSKDAILTFLAVIGEEENGTFKIVSKVSKEYTLKVLKHIKE